MIRLAIRVRRESAELVLAELIELAPSGVEELDDRRRADRVRRLRRCRRAADGSEPDRGRRRGAGRDPHRGVADDWADRWRDFHAPLVIDGALIVRPPWIAPGAQPIDLVIDPGRAFGTGAHATTRLCLELMLELVGEDGLAAAQVDFASGVRAASGRRGGFLDLGCGSGVLAIAAVLLGWGPVLALDNDPAAIQATQENARRNRIALAVRRHDLRMDKALVAPTIVANLLAPLLITWAKRLAQSGEIPDQVIVGGLTPSERDSVSAAFAVCGLREAARRSSGDWIAMLLERMP